MENEENEEEEFNEQEEFEEEEDEVENENQITKQSPKYYRNNNLIHKGNAQKRKIFRSSREENPLKSVAQKLCNTAFEEEQTKKEKDKTEYDNTNNDLDNLGENEDYI